MHYILMLWPHANARYRSSMSKLACAELAVMQPCLPRETVAAPCEVLGLPAIALTCPQAPDENALRHLSRLSLLYALFRKEENGSLTPVIGRAPCAVGEDLPAILKYKGKTNEQFTALLVNAALYASDFRNEDNLTLTDPMCGRGTTLFEGLNRGWNVTGSDVDRAGLKEAEVFFKRYLEYHRFKHSFAHTNLTLPQKKCAPCAQFTLPDAGGISLRLIEADACRLPSLFGKKRTHLVVTDLPYGVQHNAHGDTPERLLRRALPAWTQCLQYGGAVALSFNAQTLKKQTVLDCLQSAGLTPVHTQVDFSHWVEQAITRDVAIAIKAR